jgi:hypothetical protein
MIAERESKEEQTQKYDERSAVVSTHPSCLPIASWMIWWEPDSHKLSCIGA